MKNDDKLITINGIGSKKATLLSSRGIETLYDLLHYFPRRYEDRINSKPIIDIIDLERTSALVTIARKFEMSFSSRSRKQFLRGVAEDGTGLVDIYFFNSNYIKDKISVGDKVRIFGTFRKNRGRTSITNPKIAYTLDDEDLTLDPVYRSIEGIKQGDLKHAIREIIEGLEISEYLDESLLVRYDIITRNEAYRYIHFPNSLRDVERARKRLIFDELFLFLLYIYYDREGYSSGISNRLRIDHKKIDSFIATLPFSLTADQQEAINSILADVSSSKPMMRLLQGDVGSGKTIVALIALLVSAINSKQGLIIAPTEILARQHYQTFSLLLKDWPIRIALLVGGMNESSKNAVREGVENGDYDIVVGTHALIEDKTSFKDLALVVTDEQHRFGVKQRAKLESKSDLVPHVLVMTATPIPRTLTYLIYGDLDVSTIREKPRGRIPIKTYVVDKSYRDRVYSFAMKEIQKGRSVYIVCPHIEEDDEALISSVERVYSELENRGFSMKDVEILHGKLKPSEKERIMNTFNDGSTRLLVSTTVVEVGVDNKNASLIVIENGERFGLAQLHQLRGRVGRGEHESYCVVFNESSSIKATKRLEIFKDNNDGFDLAEQDLLIRGPGEFLGYKQHGSMPFRLASLIDNYDIIKQTMGMAKDIISKDCFLKEKEHASLKQEMLLNFQCKYKGIALN